jgi:hypothetical protein
MKTVFKSFICFIFLSIILFSAGACFLFNEKVSNYYVVINAKTYLVNVKGPLYARDSFPYYSFDSINDMHDTSHLGLFFSLQLLYTDSASPYSAQAAIEPGRSGPRQTIDSLSFWLISNKSKPVNITKNLVRTDSINSYKYNNWLSMFDFQKGWAGSCAGPDCVAYAGYAYSEPSVFVKAFNSRNVGFGYIGSSMDMLYFPDHEVLSGILDATSILTRIHFTDGFSISYEMKIRN